MIGLCIHDWAIFLSRSQIFSHRIISSCYIFASLHIMYIILHIVGFLVWHGFKLCCCTRYISCSIWLTVLRDVGIVILKEIDDWFGPLSHVDIIVRWCFRRAPILVLEILLSYNVALRPHVGWVILFVRRRLHRGPVLVWVVLNVRQCSSRPHIGLYITDHGL